MKLSMFRLLYVHLDVTHCETKQIYSLSHLIQVWHLDIRSQTLHNPSNPQTHKMLLRKTHWSTVLPVYPHDVCKRVRIPQSLYLCHLRVPCHVTFRYPHWVWNVWTHPYSTACHLLCHRNAIGTRVVRESNALPSYVYTCFLDRFRFYSLFSLRLTFVNVCLTTVICT